jgi:hypothetical protein
MANGTLKVENIQTSSGSGTITLGQSGETITVPTGVTVGGNISNTPAFEARLSSAQTVSDSTDTKAQIDNILFDTDNCYDNTTNYRFTPTVAGKYFIYGNISAFSQNASQLNIARCSIYKNGSVVKVANLDFRNNPARYILNPVSTVQEANGTTDYFEFFGYISGSGTDTFEANTSANDGTRFGAYRLIGA